MKNFDFLKKIMLAIVLATSFAFVNAQTKTTLLDFETMVDGDTIFVDQGNLVDSIKPLNWVFDDKSPDKNSYGERVPDYMAVPTLVDGVVGKAMQFDGKKEWVLLQHPYAFANNRDVNHFAQESESFTASVWINNEKTSVNPPKAAEQVIYNTLGTGLVIKNDTLWAGCYVKDRADGSRYRGGTLIQIPFTTTNEWTNIVSVFEGKAVNDSTSLFKVYINGVEVASDTVLAGSLYSDEYDAAYVGAHYKWGVMDNLGVVSYVAEGDVNGYYKGLLDEFATSTSAMSASDIRKAYYAITDPDMDLTSTHLDFETLLAGDTVFQEMGSMMANEQPLNQVFDSKHPDKDPDGNNTRYPDHGSVPNLVEGIVGQAMEFDGKKEWILLQKAYDKGEPFNVETEDFSASVWFNNATTHTNPPKNPDQFIYDLGGQGGFALQIREDTLWATCYSRDRDDSAKPKDGGIVKIPFTTTGEWTNVTSVFDGMAVGDSASIFKVYVNGELVGQDTVNTPKLYAEWYSASAVGAKYKWCSMDVMGKSSYIAEGDIAGYFKGMIDELTTTQTALSSSDVKDIIYAVKGDATTHLDFETLLEGDTVFQEMGNMLASDQPLNQVFDSKHPDKDPDGNNTRYPDHGSVPTLVEGVIGQAMQFDGKKEWILLQKAYDKGMPFNYETEDFSASVWFNNATTHTNPPKNPDQFIYDLGGQGGFALQVREDTLWATCYSRDRDDSAKPKDGGIVKIPFTTTDTWTNVVSVFDGMAVGDSASIFKVYVNGELVGQDTVNTPKLYAEWYSASAVGAKYKWCSMDVMGKSSYIAEGDIAGYFKGMIDELTTTQKVMSESEIRKGYLSNLDIQKVTYDFENQADGDSIIIDGEGGWNASFHSSFLTKDEQAGHNPHMLPAGGQAIFAPGIKDEGQAMVFDGKKDWVNVQIKYDGNYPDGVAPFGDSYDNLTARVWINPVATSVNPPKTPEQMIIMVGHSNGVAMMIEKDTLYAGVAIRERGGDKKYKSNVILSTPFTRADMWSQVAIVLEGQAVSDTVSKAILYVNGNEVASAEIAGDMIYSSYFNSTAIGGQYSWNPLGPVMTYNNDSEVGCYFKGKMDNVLITKEAISADDMAADYNANRPTGIESFNSENINVYPNPTTGTIYLNLSDLKESANVKVLNMVGVVVKNKTIEMPGSRETLNLNGLNTGLYFIRVQSGDKVHTSKVQLVK